MKNVKDIYQKIGVPNASDDLEAKIIEKSMRNNGFNLPKLAMIAACLVIVIGVWSNEPKTTEITEINGITLSSDNILYDIEFFEEDSFVDDISA